MNYEKASENEVFLLLNFPKLMTQDAREIADIVALTALVNALPQLKVHIHGALNVGSSREEII